jgi:hypothetical protein
MREKAASRNKWYSIRWFHCGFLHIKKGRIIGHSCTGLGKRLVYYYGRNAISVSDRNITGEFVQFDAHGNCVGYSRRERPWRVVHYNHQGEYLGKSFIFLGFLVIHSAFPLFSPASAARRNIPHHRWIPYLVHNIILPSQLVHSIIDYTDRMRKFCAQIRKALTKSS